MLFTSKEKIWTNSQDRGGFRIPPLVFGSPDILGLCDGLCEHFGAEGLLIQPDDLNRPLVELNFKANVRSLRIFSLLPTYARSWRWSYFQQAGKALDKFPGGYRRGRRPERIRRRTGHALEAQVHGLLHARTGNAWLLYARLHEYGNARFDAYIVHDTERHAIDFNNLRWKKDVLVEPILLTAPIDYPNPLVPRPWNKRNGQMIYFGHIHPEETLLENMLGPELDDYPIKILRARQGAER